MGKSSINGPSPMAILNNQRVHDDTLVHPPNLHRPEPLKAHHVQVKPPETSPVRQFIALVVR